MPKTTPQAKKANRKWYLGNTEYAKQRSRAYGKQNKTRIAARKKKYYAAHVKQEKSRVRSWRKRQPWDRLAASRRKEQGLPSPLWPATMNCECCGLLPGKKGIVLDHCHTSGRFRGWLCGKCNMGLGLLGDSEAGLRKALRYITQLDPFL